MLAGGVFNFYFWNFNECLFLFLCFFFFLKKISPTVNVKTVRIVTNGTFLALFKRVNHWSERDEESFSDFLPLDLMPTYSRVMRRAAYVTFDTS